MSEWQLVEAEPSSPVREMRKDGGRRDSRGEPRRASGEGGFNSQQQGGRGGGRGGFHNSRNNNGGFKSYSNRSLGPAAVRQIEYLMSPENLAMDLYYIRPYMDEQGYVPLAYMCNFPNVLGIGAQYEDIVSTLVDNEKRLLQQQEATASATASPAQTSAAPPSPLKVVYADGTTSTTTATSSSSSSSTETDSAGAAATSATPAAPTAAAPKRHFHVPTVEFDRENELVRVKGNWRMWLMPNGNGGVGLPRYIKESPAPLQGQGQGQGKAQDGAPKQERAKGDREPRSGGGGGRGFREGGGRNNNRNHREGGRGGNNSGPGSNSKDSTKGPAPKLEPTPMGGNPAPGTYAAMAAAGVIPPAP